MSSPHPDSAAGHPEPARPAAGQLTLGMPVQFLPGAGPRRAQALKKLGIETLADLIKHLPHRHQRYEGRQPIGQAAADSLVTCCGQVIECRWISGRGSPIGRGQGGGRGRFTATVEDDTGALEVIWFNASYLKDRLHPGTWLRLTGKIGTYKETLQMTNPQMEILESEPESEETSSGPGLQPVYPATELLSTHQIEKLLAPALPQVLDQIEDHFSADDLGELAMPSLAESYRRVHLPRDEEEVRSGLRRLAYDELFFLQLGLSLNRERNERFLKASPLKFSATLDRHIRKRLPFEMTASQNRVVGEIAADLQKSIPMNRLLQGDVGSGKTAVALYAMLLAAADGQQAALMAPTELLAEQHAASIRRMLKDSEVRIGLLTGSLTATRKQHLLHAIERGETDLVIGTQALLGNQVKFKDLALVVIDEQHRFGVLQRAEIRSRQGEPDTVPHTLVMTATPIPRTLSLTIFSDLDVSTIDSLPPGRSPIVTRVVKPEQADEVYGYLAERLAAGEQAYVVLPTIDENSGELKAVRSHLKMLEDTHFKGRRLAAVHGRLDREQRERIMEKFRAGQIDVLVATTVIEVGVDVPNASLMVVEHADRFGLAQLHQLRGRVGRGTRKSLCVFIADPITDEAQQRMQAIAATLDGFQIAESDLEIRGIGEFFGTRQSGLPPFRVADLKRHRDLMRLARKHAQRIARSDPRLEQPGYRLLRQRLLKLHGSGLGLAEIG